MPDVHDPAAGAISFQVLAEIAFGATARVDLCKALKSNRPGVEGQLLAVKRLHPHVAEDPGFATQFFDEVWMTAALKHPNVVEVKGWGTDDDGAYLAVELVQGVPLARLMKTVFETGEVFSERMVVFIGSRLARGLAAAHGLRAPGGDLLNLVHRDLTPSNVLMGFNGDVKIADFGMAKAQQRLTKTLTGLRKGEPTYMAPEQARADVIDGRADLFSLGVVLFELFAGRRPWLAKSDYEMVLIASKDPPADLRELRPKIDKELVAVVNRCLEKEPATRFQSANEIGERLDNWLTVHGYQEGNEDALGRFIRRNGMRQMRWFERAVAGEIQPKPKGARAPARGQPAADGAEPKPDRKRAPIPAAGARPAPVKAPAPPPLDEPTDVTDSAEWKIIAQKTASAPPLIVAKIEEDETEWGEEIPTLVQKDPATAEALRVARGAAAAMRGMKKGPEAAVKLPRAQVDSETEADLRATAVQRTPDQLLNRGGTIPLSAISPLSPEAALGDRPSTQATIRERGARSASTPLAGKAAGSGPAPAPAPVAAPPQAAPPPAAAEPAQGGGPPGPAGQIAAPEALELPPPAVRDDILIAEAERFSNESARRGEEARAAAARAERQAAMAKMAAESALIAAEAVRLARAGDLTGAKQRLEEARKLEQSADPARSGSLVDLDAPTIRAGSPVPMAPDPRPAPAGLQGASGMPGRGSQPLLAGERPASIVNRPIKPRPKPGMFGMPPLAIAGLGIVAFCIVFLILWLFFG